MSENDHLIKSGYSDFLQSYSWQSFYTITCRKPRRDNLAFIRDIDNAIREQSLSFRSFVAIEPHRTGFIHAHGLLSFDIPLRDPEGIYLGFSHEEINRRFRYNFGFSRDSKIRTLTKTTNGVQTGVLLYCSKYVVKCDRGYEYDFLGDWGIDKWIKRG